jgi:hypothetical protein
MDYCEQMWSGDRELEITSSDWDHCRQILSQASPSLIRILQVIRVITPSDINLLRIHFLLDFSWDELIMAICSLRSFIHDKEEGLLTKLMIVALDLTLFPVPFDMIMWDLACSSLHVIQQILRGELDESIL